MTALPLPKAVGNYLDLMAAAVGPAALFAVGLSLVGRKLVGNIGEVLWLAVLKAGINPILTFVLVTYAFVMEPLWSQAAVVLSAMPVGTNPLRHRAAIQCARQDRVAHVRHLDSHVGGHRLLCVGLLWGRLKRARARPVAEPIESGGRAKGELRRRRGRAGLDTGKVSRVNRF
jgi:hypothetical protein